jgi:hypothetical protein
VSVTVSTNSTTWPLLMSESSAVSPSFVIKTTGKNWPHSCWLASMYFFFYLLSFFIFDYVIGVSFYSVPGNSSGPR